MTYEMFFVCLGEPNPNLLTPLLSVCLMIIYLAFITALLKPSRFRAGQEEGNVGVEEGITITPFNMKEELEEGHFDNDGMYHWKKENVVKDNWLENIDWVKVGQFSGQYSIFSKSTTEIWMAESTLLSFTQNRVVHFRLQN